VGRILIATKRYGTGEGFAMSMHRRLVCVLLVSTLVAGCAEELTDDACKKNPDKQTYKLKFKVKRNGCVEQVLKENGTDGQTITVRRCDTVRWNFASLKKKSVVFDSSNGSPFLWSDSGFQYMDIKGVVRSDASEGRYEYVVRTQGIECGHDPMIIVER
jgi:hypothetical protein